MRHSLALATLAVLLATTIPAPAAAQEPPPLGEVLNSLADLWDSGDASAITALSAASGVDIEIGGVTLGSVTGRKLTAALRHVFDDWVSVSVVYNMTSPVMGVEDRAFGELTWEIRHAGATASERTTVFLALVREPAGWRVTQIRILE